ncbi:MAG: mechanosensitive ion channel domain-containing protein [Vicinamibacterales bacterium]
MSPRQLNRCLLTLTAAALLVLPAAGFAQPPTAPVPAAPAPVEPSEPAVADDSPRASAAAFMAAADAGRWDEAARYLVLTPEQRPRAAELAERLKGVIDSRRLLDLEAVSGASAGAEDDRLPPEVEDVTAADAPGGERLRMVRAADERGPYWAFSPATVSRIDAWWGDLPDRWIRDALTGTRFDVLLRPGLFGVLWWHWIVLPFVAVVAWAAGRGLRAVAGRVVRSFTRRTDTAWDDRLLASLSPPLTLGFSVIVFVAAFRLMEVTRGDLAFLRLLTRPLLAVAVFWGLWRVVPVMVAWAGSQSWAATSPSTRNLLSIGANITRGAIVGLGILAVIAALGYPVGTVLAGLGIGGLALAFGAQKTVENLFGSVALAVDQPIRIGDFVRVDDFVGTVEDIGLRSTRFRTLDRTVVSIPNGQLAGQRLESFQLRDRMRLATTIGLTYDTTQSQMRTVLAGFERVLRAHPHIWPDAVVVRFKEFGASSLDIEIMAWFAVPTWGDFQVCREEVLLGFMGVVEEAGASFAFPTRTVHLVGPAPAPPPGGER